MLSAALSDRPQPEDRRPWPVVDLVYVREQYSARTAADIASELGVSAQRVKGLISSRGWRKNGTVRDVRKPPRPDLKICTALGRGTAGDRVLGGTDAAAMAQKRASGPQSAPSDLLEFLGGLSLRDAARSLGLSKGTVSRLREGYWPTDARKLLASWQRYKGRHSVVASGWFLRKVYAGGQVRHAGHAYTAAGLAARTGQLLAVSRSADGGLLAQTLDFPAERLSLTQLGALA